MVVYDNVDDPQLDLSSLLPKGSGCDIVITSRNHSISEISPTSHLKLDAMPMDEAMELLFLPPNRSLNSREQAREIAELLGCLPIALTQARSYMYQTQCSGSHYLQILHDGRAALLAEPVAHQRDMRYLSTDAAFDASFKQLAERSQQALFLSSHLHRTNIPLYLVTLAAKSNFIHYERKYVEYGDVYHTGKALLENIFLQDGKFRITDLNKSMVSLQNYSLVTVVPGVDTRLVQMHPLVHAWVQSRIPEGRVSEYQAAAVVLLALGARKEHTPLVQYLPSHVTHLAPVWNELHANEAMAFGSIMCNGGHFNDALRLQERGVSELRGQLNSDNEVTTSASNNLGNTYRLSGRLDDAKVLLEEVLRLRKEILGEQHPDTISTSNNLAKTYVDLGRLVDAKVLLEKVVQLRKEILGERHPDTISASSNLAVIYNYVGRLEDAKVLQEKVLALNKEILGDRHPDTISASNNLAKMYSDLGRVEDALAIKVEVLRLRKEILGERHPDTISASSNLANTYAGLGRLEDAKALEEEVLRLRKEILGERHPQTIAASRNLAVTYSELGRVQDALVLEEEVLRLRRDILGEHHPDTIRASGNLAITYNHMGRLEDAKVLQEGVLRLMKDILGEQHPDTISASGYLAKTYIDLGRLVDAEALLEKVLEWRKQILGEQDPDTITASYALAHTKEKLAAATTL